LRERYIEREQAVGDQRRGCGDGDERRRGRGGDSCGRDDAPAAGDRKTTSWVSGKTVARDEALAECLVFGFEERASSQSADRESLLYRPEWSCSQFGGGGGGAT